MIAALIIAYNFAMLKI